MKKFLALVLALVMTMSLVTISSSAAFDDADSIKYDEAVNTLVSLGVINGKGGNVFDPDGGVTRAEMAKMITFISLGVAEASAFEGTKTDLTDVDNHWAEAFIKYCYSQGIIAGKGNGKFDPDAAVTTAEAAKMLLVAIGWSADVQGYVGEQWKVNTVRDAFKSKIFEGINLAADKALTRDEAAKLTYNTMLTNTVRQVPTLGLDNGNITVAYHHDGASLLSKTFDAYRFVGQIEDISYNSATKEYTYADNGESGLGQTFEEADGLVNDVASFTTTEDYTGLIFEEVSVIAKKSGTGYEVLGIASTGAVTTMTVAVSELGEVSGKLKVNGVSYAVENEMLTSNLVSDAKVMQAAVVAGTTAMDYDLVKVVDIDVNGKLDAVYEYGLTAGKVVYVSDKEIITNNGNSFYFAEDDIEDGIAVDDYVYSYDHIDGTSVVCEIDAFEATASAIKPGKDAVQYDGAWYNDGDVDDDDDFTAGNTYRVWAINGVVIASKQLDGSSIENLVMVYDNSSSAWINEVKYIDVNGAKHTVKVDSKNADGTALALGSITAGELYIINETDDGVEFIAPSNVSISNYEWNVDGTVGLDSDSEIDKVDTYKIANDAVVLVYGESGGAAKISGAQLKNLTATAVAADKNINTTAYGYYLHTNANGLLDRLTHIGVKFNGDISDLYATSGNELYAYVTSDAYRIKINGSNYSEFSIWNGSENLTVRWKDNTLLKKGDVIRYDEINDSGIISGIVNLNATSAAVYGIEGSYVFVDKTNSYKTSGDTKYLYVNSNASSADEIGKNAGELKVATKYADGTLVMDNIAYAVNSNGYEIIVIDVANSMTRGDNTSDVLGATAYTDTETVKEGDAVVFDFGANTVTISGVRDAKGNTVTSATGVVTLFAIGNGTDIVVS